MTREYKVRLSLTVEAESISNVRLNDSSTYLLLSIRKSGLHDRK